MDILKIAALLLMVFVLATVLDSGWLSESDSLAKVYLDIEMIDELEERPGNVSIVGKNSVRDVGVLARVRGNSTISAEKKSYSLRFATKTSLLGMNGSRRWALIGFPFDKTLIRTPLAFEYARAIGMEHVSQSEFCEVYLNGQYKGLYLMMQPITFSSLGMESGDGNFIIERNSWRQEIGVSYIMTNDELRFEINYGPVEDQVYMQECWDTVNYAEAYIQSGDEELYSKFIDVDSFVDMYIVQELIKSVDFAKTSDRYYLKNGKLYAGPIWDVDLSMGNVSTQESQYRKYHNTTDDGLGDSAEMLWAQSDWYKWLCQDPNFMRRVCKRWREIYPITENLVYDNELGKNRIDALTERYRQAIEDNYDESRGWSINEKYSIYEYDGEFSSYEEAVEHLREWLIWRIEWLNDEFAWIEEGL